MKDWMCQSRLTQMAKLTLFHKPTTTFWVIPEFNLPKQNIKTISKCFSNKLSSSAPLPTVAANQKPNIKQILNFQ